LSWETGIWPDEWTQSVFIPLPKKGDLLQCNNYRTIALVSHASKILMRVILDRMQIKLESEIAQDKLDFGQEEEHAIRLPTSGSFWRRQGKEIRQCASASSTS